MKEKKLNWKDNDTILGMIMLFFGIVYGGLTLQIPGTKSQLFDSRFVPILLTVFMIILGGLEIGRGLQKNIATEKEKKEFDTKTVIITFVLIILYILLYSVLGFIITTFLFLFLEMNVLTPTYVRKNQLVYLLISLFFAFGIYYLFYFGFTIFLPSGILYVL